MTSFERIQKELNANPVREAQIQKQMILAEEIMHQKRQEKEEYEYFQHVVVNYGDPGLFEW